MSLEDMSLSMVSGQYAQSLDAPFFVILLLVVGVLCNLLALLVLRRTRSRTNKRHVFLLRCQFTQDTMTLASNLILYVMSLSKPDVFTEWWACKFRLILVFLNLSTCSVIFLMAVERWLAVTCPFFYHSNVTFRLLKQIMIMFWLGMLSVVGITFFHVGIYWDEESSTCIRNRNSKKPLDVLYTYMIFGLGVFFCVAIVYTNLAVIKVLSTKDGVFEKYNTMKRRVYSKNVLARESTTREERAFAWLMISLCIAFVSCCVPYVILMPLNRFIDNEKQMLPINAMVDLLMMVHCLLDPCLYVLQRWTLVQSSLMYSKIENVTKLGILTV